MDMVERVARALCKRCRVIPSCDCDGKLGTLEDDARAAIAALREPTPEMVEAGAEHQYGHPRHKAEEWGKSDKFDMRCDEAEKLFTAMIDAALDPAGR